VDRHSSLCRSLNNLGVLYRDLGDFEQALPRATEALEMCQRLYEGAHFEVAKALANLGGLYRNMANFERAYSLMQQALEMYQQVYEGNHRDVTALLRLPSLCPGISYLMVARAWLYDSWR
jgi:tetratricopeptide (TPR) repeat protein